MSSAKKRGTEYYGKRGKSNLYGRGKTVLFLVVPCYNEEEVIVSSAEELENKLSSLGKEGRISGRSRIVLTLLVFIVFIRQHQKNELLTYLLYQAVSFALMCGMEAVSGVFMPRMLITFYIMQACGGLAALF
ncbi:MAG: hypothetical protein SPL54_07455, partial [Lachnospiraceae bacterium]|nr:hypothetical protein [Lachnospiraceae bacterium]